MMEFLLWALIALLAYSLVAPIMSIVTEDVPPTAGLFLSTIVFLVLATVVMVLTGTADPAYAVGADAAIIYVAGVFLAIGILAYAKALQTGPVSIVVPIFGMFFVGSALIGIVFLDESISATSAAGIGCAVVAIYLGASDRG